jgi:hypothetical protein
VQEANAETIMIAPIYRPDPPTARSAPTRAAQSQQLVIPQPSFAPLKAQAQRAFEMAQQPPRMPVIQQPPRSAPQFGNLAATAGTFFGLSLAAALFIAIAGSIFSGFLLYIGAYLGAKVFGPLPTRQTDEPRLPQFAVSPDKPMRDLPHRHVEPPPPRFDNIPDATA